MVTSVYSENFKYVLPNSLPDIQFEALNKMFENDTSNDISIEIYVGNLFPYPCLYVRKIYIDGIDMGEEYTKNKIYGFLETCDDKYSEVIDFDNIP